ncbi:MAG: tetratricopeptide repeat protein [Bryobacteraceae bacterium]
MFLALAHAAHLDLARQMTNTGDWRGALREFQLARQAGEHAPFLPVSIAMCHEHLEQWRAAIDELHPYVKQYPDDSRASYYLGNAQFFEREFEPARQAFARAIALNASYTDAYRGLGLADLELKDYNGAYHAWLKAVSLDKSDEKSRYYLGRLFYEANLPDQAAYWLRRALALDAGDYKAQTYLGLSAEVLHFPDTALALYRSAIQLSNQRGKPYAWAYLSLAKLLRQRGDGQRALATIEEAVAKCPEPHELTLFAEMLVPRRETQRAEQLLRRAIAMDGSLSEPHYRLALLLRRAGKAEEAQREMDLFRETKAREDRQPKVAAILKSATSQ